MSKTFEFYSGSRHQVTCVAPIYEELLIEEKQSVTGSKCHRRINDVFLLLNQDRLDRQTLDEIVKRIESVTSTSQLAALRNKYSDKELCDRVKSRYIQSKAELQDYMRQLMIEDDFNKQEHKYQQLLKEAEKKAKEKEEEEDEKKKSQSVSENT